MKTSELEQAISDAKDFDENLIRENGISDFCLLVAEFMDKNGISRAELIRRLTIEADIDRNYGYQLLNGTRVPTRTRVIQIGLLLGLDIDGLQRLLKSARKKPLYVRDLFDAKVFYAIRHKLPSEKAFEFIWNS